MMDDLSWPTLKERRTKTRLINFYKISNNKMKYRTQTYLYQINQKPELHTRKHLDNFLAKKTALNILSFVIQYRIGINSLKP
jgi:t-SNARE complex subunit (syntaxin)